MQVINTTAAFAFWERYCVFLPSPKCTFQMFHKTKVSLGKNISNSSCISLPQNGCKIPNISSCQLNALTYANWWKANIRHSLKQLFNSSIFCQLWKKLINTVKPQPTWKSREAGVKLRFYGSLRWQKWSNCQGKKCWQ